MSLVLWFVCVPYRLLCWKLHSSCGGMRGDAYWEGLGRGSETFLNVCQCLNHGSGVSDLEFGPFLLA